MKTIYISEEYGYRSWLAKVEDSEMPELIRRWETIKGINCLVDVRKIFPTAVQIDGYNEDVDYTAHVHEPEDSYFSATGYKIPEAENFEIDGSPES
jgi:hypothetical protein